MFFVRCSLIVKSLLILILILILILNATLINCRSFQDDEDEGEFDEFNEKRLLSNVDLPPFFFGAGMVTVQLHLEDISSLSGINMQFRMDYYLEHKWTVNNDYCKFYEKELKARKATLNVGEQTLIADWNIIQSLFWTPDTYLATAKKIEMPSKRIDMRMLYINRTKDQCVMDLITRLDAIVSCQMDFHKFPIDVQRCETPFLSISYDVTSIIYAWDKQAVDVNPAIKILNYDFKFKTYPAIRMSLNDTYSALVVVFSFARQIYSSLIQVYAPSTLIVGMTWFSFWMGLEAIPGRMTLCVTSLLALITQFSSIRSELPPVAYVNGADIWMLACMILVFLSMMEFAVIKYIFSSNEVGVERRKTVLYNRLKKLDSRHNFGEEMITDILNFKSYPLKPSYKNSHQSSNDSNVWFTNDQIEPRRRRTANYVNQFLLNLDTDISTKRTMINNFDEMQEQRIKTTNLVTRIDCSFRVLYPLMFLLFNVVYWPILLL